jgi:23S rRNA pseudouridine2605 synthase
VPDARAPASAAGERLQKLLAGAGLGSRREVERWIVAGRLRVNGAVALLGTRAGAQDRIELDGEPVPLSSRAGAGRLLLYHKPVGELVTRRDPQRRPTVFDRLPAPGAGRRWVAVGRLDLNSSGLLLVTDSGELAHALMHPRFGLEREYRARIRGELSALERRRLLEGVRLADGLARFSAIEPEPVRGAPGSNRWYRVRLGEGRNREVRRMFELQGHPVSRLLRTAYGPFVLPADLAAGSWKDVPAAEVRRLMERVSDRRKHVVRQPETC